MPKNGDSDVDVDGDVDSAWLTLSLAGNIRVYSEQHV